MLNRIMTCATLSGCLEAHEELLSWEVNNVIPVQACRLLLFIFTSSPSQESPTLTDNKDNDRIRSMSHTCVWLRIQIIESQYDLNFVFQIYVKRSLYARIPLANLVPIKSNTISYFSGYLSIYIYIFFFLLALQSQLGPWPSSMKLFVSFLFARP